MRSASSTVESRCAMTTVVRPLHEPRERVLHLPLAFRIERGGGFVEKQDRRIAQHGAGDRDALALPAGKLQAAFADAGVIALVAVRK